jgi:cellulose synthase/poly-beta-1,6-N-acetylglucosamine synthase-like glycosyltransferase
MTDAIELIVLAAVVALSLRRGTFLVAALMPPRRLPRGVGLPSVTVLVPARNERAVAERLLRSLVRLDYPADKVSFVIVCDGCSDESPTVFRAWAAERSNARVVVLPKRGGKGAALNAGLRLVETEIVAVVDADLAPRPDFLLQLVPAFADDRVAAAAAFLHPANADDNIVTRYAAVTTWVHQLMTSAGTDRLGLNPPTLGAAAFRRKALEEIGGFPVVPAGVDVGTSSALIRRGWRTRFVRGAVADNTLVSRVRDFWRQHVRWSRAVFRGSHTDTPPAERPPATISWPQRLEMAAASIGYADRLVFAVAALGALAGTFSVWIPLLYLAVPGLEIIAALLKAGVGLRIVWFLSATALFFVADLVGSVAAVLIHLTRRPYRWHSPRWLQHAERNQGL